MQLDSATDVTEEIYDTACRLLDSLWDGRPLRLLGVSTSRVSYEEYRQYNLFDREKYDRLEKMQSGHRHHPGPVRRGLRHARQLSENGTFPHQRRSEQGEAGGASHGEKSAEEGKKRRLRRLSQPFAFLSRFRDMADWVFCTFWVCRNSEGVQAL